MRSGANWSPKGEYMNFNKDEVLISDNGKIEYLQFKRLLKYPNVNHAYIFKTYDMNFRVGQNFRLIEQVKHNLKIVCDNCGFKYETIVRPDYNHTNNVAVIDMVDTSDEVPELKGKRFIDIDTLITDKKDITIMSTNADCNLLLVYDPVKSVIANIHAGWKGTFDKIAKNAIEKMISTYDCNPKDIEVYFCPSIRKCHFEVDEDVKEICENNFRYTGRLDEIISIGEIKEGKQKYLIDTVLINKILLENVGILPQNIVDCEICSVCEKDKIHSRRVEGFYFGLAAAFIAKRG